LGGNVPKIDPLWVHHLDILDLNGCGLDHVPRLLQYASQLTFLSLENNDIMDMSLLILNRKLKVVQLARNRLSNLIHVSDVVSKLPLLSILDIRYCSLTRDNQFASPTASQVQKDVANILLRTTIILAGKNLKMLNQEPITHSDRRGAIKKMDTLKRIAMQQDQYKTTKSRKNVDQRRLQDWEPQPNPDWKPEFYPLEDITVGDDIILEVVE
jgi:Leucine-rich repeat (LRR) protein